MHPPDHSRHRPFSSNRARERYGLLLGAIIAAFAVQGIANPGRWEETVVSVLLAATLLLALRAADAEPRIMLPAALLSVAVVLFSVIEAAIGNVDSAPSRIANLLLVTLAPPAIVVGIVRSLRARNRVTVEAVFGVLCLYILFGMFFAFAYGSIDRLGGSFFANGVGATVARCLYYSFATLTTVGYGDFTAASNLGHTLSVAEALFGQVYLVTVVSLIVGNLGRSPRPANDPVGGSPARGGGDPSPGE
jgi:Ion channel